MSHSLQDKQISGAVIDVCNYEPISSHHPFLGLQSFLRTNS